jgi:hypothetical protein
MQSKKYNSLNFYFAKMLEQVNLYFSKSSPLGFQSSGLIFQFRRLEMIENKNRSSFWIPAVNPLKSESESPYPLGINFLYIRG